jgi:FkbM family methyltransferase
VSIVTLLTKIPLFPLWPKEIELDGIKIPVRNSPLIPQMRRHLMKGRYEAAERELATVFIRPGDQVLEIGASIGIVTSFLARSSGRTGRVVSVEPNLKLREAFERQLSLNGLRVELIHALCCPLWKQPVPEPVASQRYRAARSSLSGRTTKSGEVGIEVPWTTADEVCRKTSLEPTALVADIEGTEAVWAEYPPHFPDSLRTIIVELHAHLIGAGVAGRVAQTVITNGFRVAGFRNNVFAFQRG